VFARAAEFAEDTIYVIGGLYGNAFALDAIENLSKQEPVRPRLIFNGDFHWFDAEPDLYSEIQSRVIGTPDNAADGRLPDTVVAHGGRSDAVLALRGNVETEIANDDPAAGCGCAYPESVPDDDVERSNAILERLRKVSRSLSSGADALTLLHNQLPMHAVVQVGGARIAIVHGDAWSLAGWRFAHDALHDPENEAMLTTAFDQAAVDGFACSHTCAPALKVHGDRFVINNGAAGMANFEDTTHGVITRVSTRPLPRAIARSRLYGIQHDGVFVEALRVDFDFEAWLRRFDALWSAASPAAFSYRRRIAKGPRFTLAQALGTATNTSSCAAVV